MSTAAPSAEEFRRAVGRFTTGVTVMTTAHEGVLHGMTANAFASVSLDPLLVLVCVGRGAGMHEIMSRSKAFAVTVLAADQQRESVWFASPRRPSGQDQFDGIGWRPAPVTGCPLIDGGIAYIDCAVADVHAGGDHSIFLGQVVDVGILSDAEPLLFFDGAYRQLAAQPVPNRRSP